MGCALCAKRKKKMETKITKSTRPPFLEALCLLSFIGSSVSFAIFLLAAIFFEKAGEIIIKYSSWHTVDQISPLYFFLLSGFHLLSFSGVARMWKLHRDGLPIYILAQLIIMFFPSVWIGWQAFSVTNAIFTGVFIGGYILNLKNLSCPIIKWFNR
jgi:hypothetical protein